MGKDDSSEADFYTESDESRDLDVLTCPYCGCRCEGSDDLDDHINNWCFLAKQILNKAAHLQTIQSRMPMNVVNANRARDQQTHIEDARNRQVVEKIKSNIRKEITKRVAHELEANSEPLWPKECHYITMVFVGFWCAAACYTILLYGL